MALFTPRSPDMNTGTGLAPSFMPVHLLVLNERAEIGTRREHDKRRKVVFILQLNEM